MVSFSIRLAILVLLTTAGGAGALADDLETLRNRVDSAAERAMAEEHLPGLIVAVAFRGEVLLQRGYGYAKLDPPTPVDPRRSLFRIGSISKALTGLAAARLIDRGDLTLATPVQDLIDSVEGHTPASPPIEIRHLLTHTAGFDQIGIERQIYAYDLPLAARLAQRPTLGSWLADGQLRPVRAPGQSFTYDTYGITALGHVIEQVTGESYRSAMQSLLFEPLGMTHSAVEAAPARRGDLAVGHGYVDGEFVAQPYEVYVTTPASSIDSTAADMGRLLAALTGDGANGHGRLLSATALAALFRGQYRPHPQFPGVTYAFFDEPTVVDGQSYASIGHGGSMLGFRSLLLVLPDARLGVFVSANRDSEAGGGPVLAPGKIANAAIRWLEGAGARPVHTFIPKAPSPALQEYAGDYRYSVYCHLCTEEEFEAGGWPPGRPVAVRVADDALVIRDERFMATAQRDVFAREDGTRAVFFRRDPLGEVQSYSYSTSADTFERVTAP